jgi:hypothetical protein
VAMFGQPGKWCPCDDLLEHTEAGIARKVRCPIARARR